MEGGFLNIVQLFDLPGAAGEGDNEDGPAKVGRNAKESEELGSKNLAEGRYLDAIDHFKRAVQQGSQSGKMDLAATYEAADMLPQAYHQYLLAKREKDSGELHAGLGALYKRYGRMKESIGEMEEAVRLDPEKPFPRFKLAENLRNQGFREDALKAITGAVACQPDDPFYHYWQADLLVEMKKFDLAVPAIHAAIELSPGDDHLFQLAAIALWGSGKKAEALRAARLANDLNVDHLAHGILLASLLRESGLPEESLQEQKRLVRADEYDYDRIGRLLGCIGVVPAEPPGPELA